MKAKHVITTFAFAAAMALGVAGGLSRAKVEKASAAGVKTLYCKMTYSWWTVDGAAVGVHYWGGDESTSWPGIRGTAVDGDPGVWKFEVPENSSGLIFTRVNGSGDIADWGAKTADLTLPTGDNNLYTITSSSPAWGDPGVTGEWSHYEEPDPEEDHTYAYSINGGAAVELVEHEGSEVKSPAKVTMAVGDTITFTKDGEAYAVAAKDDDQLTKVFSNGGVLTAAVAIDEVIYLDTSTAKLWAGQFPEGYFLLGVGGQWNTKLGLAAEKEAEGDAYVVENVVLAADAEVQMIKTPATGTEVTYYKAEEGKVATSSEVEFEAEAGEYASNLKVLNAGTYDIYYNPVTGWYSIEDVNYEPDVPAEEGYYICGLVDFKYATATKMENTVGDNVAEYLGLTVEVGDKIRVRSYYNDQEPKDRWANAGDDFEKIDYGELDGDDFKFTKAGDYDIYAKYEEAAFKFYVAPHYVAPTYTVQVDDGTPEALTLNEGTEYMTDEIALEAGSTVKVLANGVEDTDFEFKHIGNNNYVEDTGKVLADAVARVYVDISAKTIFVGGLDFGGYHLLVNGEIYHKMTHNETPDDPRYLEYFSQAISFAKDDSIRFIDTSSASGYAVLFDITTINEYSVEGFEVVDGVLTANKAVNASVYLKLNDVLGDEVYLGTVSEALQAAINFAKAFNTAIEGVCNENIKTSEITDEYKLAVKTAWNAQKAPFEALEIEESRTILREATALHSVEDIAKFAAKYDSIFALRGAEYGLEDFAGRAAASSGAVVPMNNNNAALIIVVSIIAGVSLVGLSTLLILKKKHK